jgi:hypothetical protein
LSLAQTFAAARYLVAYTVAVGSTTRLIFNHDDLATFDARQSQFEELTALGDVNERFPSIARLFVNRRSLGITAIPSRFVILRERSSCAAACTALLDSASATAGSKFQFSFTVVSDLNPVELADLAADVSPRAETHGLGLTLQMPGFSLATGSTLALLSPLLSSSSLDPRPRAA